MHIKLVRLSILKFGLLAILSIQDRQRPPLFVFCLSYTADYSSPNVCEDFSRARIFPSARFFLP